MSAFYWLLLYNGNLLTIHERMRQNKQEKISLFVRDIV